jgi:catechol 2,3-dioxygenase-like lactoylglutathione lyase family enzyme
MGPGLRHVVGPGRRDTAVSGGTRRGGVGKRSVAGLVGGRWQPPAIGEGLQRPFRGAEALDADVRFRPSTTVPLRMMRSNVMPRTYDGLVIDHLGINCAEYAKSKEFYDTVLGVLGYTRQMDYEVAIGYGKDGKPDFWIADASAGDVSGPNREIHVAFQAADTEAVQAFYDAALKLGAESLHAPRLWPEYHPGYFGAFVRDPDGNNVEAVFHGAQA